MDLAAVIGDEVTGRASVAGVQQDADGECEQALGDPLNEPGGCLREVVFESHLAFQVRDRRFDYEPAAGEAATTVAATLARAARQARAGRCCRQPVDAAGYS